MNIWLKCVVLTWLSNVVYKWQFCSRVLNIGYQPKTKSFEEGKTYSMISVNIICTKSALIFYVKGHIIIDLEHMKGEQSLGSHITTNKRISIVHQCVFSLFLLVICTLQWCSFLTDYPHYGFCTNCSFSALN